nr:reverse transcriptase domain-containing protein [Tanacetum cinerariifolium]
MSDLRRSQAKPKITKIETHLLSPTDPREFTSTLAPSVRPASQSSWPRKGKNHGRAYVRKGKGCTNRKERGKPGSVGKLSMFPHPAPVPPSPIFISSDLNFPNIFKKKRNRRSPLETQEDNAHQEKRTKGFKDTRHMSKYLYSAWKSIGWITKYRSCTYLDAADGLLDNFRGSHRRLPSPKDIYRQGKFFIGHVRALLQKLGTRHKGKAKGVKGTLEKEGTGTEEKQFLSEKHPENAEPSPPPEREIALDKEDKGEDAFAWVPANMTGIPRFVAEHELKTYSHIEPRVQRKRSITPDRRKVVKEEVEEWLKSIIVKKKDFYWTEAMEEAFQTMKKLIAELPTLTAPMKDEEITVYLSAASEVVSAVLLVERNRRQMMIHYILNSPKASGRLAKWAVELGAYGITYAPRKAIKGQVLVDFLADMMAGNDSPY